MTQSTVCCPYLPRFQILHTTGHLVGTGHQGREGERSLTAPGPIGAEVRAWRAPGPEELAQVPLGRTLHNHIQGPYTGERRWGDRKAANAAALQLCLHAHLVPAPPSWVQTPSRLMMFLCRPISFITSISETRSAKSLSEALSVRAAEGVRKLPPTTWGGCGVGDKSRSTRPRPRFR